MSIDLELFDAFKPGGHLNSHPDAILDYSGLAPCPCCGAQPKLLVWKAGRDYAFVVECLNEDCGSLPKTHVLSRDDAVRAWNLRDVSKFERAPGSAASLNKDAPEDDVWERLAREIIEGKKSAARELRPCPYCGENAQFTKWSTESGELCNVQCGGGGNSRTQCERPRTKKLPAALALQAWQGWDIRDFEHIPSTPPRGKPVLNPDLFPCPRCGTPAEINRTAEACFYVCCPNADCRMPPSSPCCGRFYAARWWNSDVRQLQAGESIYGRHACPRCAARLLIARFVRHLIVPGARLKLLGMLACSVRCFCRIGSNARYVSPRRR